MKLTEEKSVFISEHTQRSEVRCCCPARHEKEYSVTRGSGGHEKIFTAMEEKDLCCQTCAPCCARDFNITVKDTKGGSHYRMRKHRVCCTPACCDFCRCCRHRLTVHKASGGVIGLVENDNPWYTCFSHYHAYDLDGNRIYRVKKSCDCCAKCCGERKDCCCCTCVFNSELVIHGKGGRSKGKIFKLAEARAAGINEDSFDLVFPPDSSEQERIQLIAMVILIDYNQYDDIPEPPKRAAMK